MTATPLRLGNKVIVDPPVVLAPMAGVTNRAFRSLCRRFGGALLVGEMVNARGLVEGSQRSFELAAFDSDESTRSLQLYGTDPTTLGEAVRIVADRGADHVDLNFGCPVRKVTRHGGGAAVPARPRLLAAIVDAAVRAGEPYGVPVTVKMRMGIDDARMTFLTAGRAAADAGAAWVALHSRTAEQYYSGEARWDGIAELVAALPDIQVLGNGDIWSADDALRMQRETGCAGVVVGRGCLGRPWFFGELQAAYRGEERPAPPTVGEIAAIKEAITQNSAAISILDRYIREAYAEQSGLERDLKFDAGHPAHAAELEARIGRAKGKTKALDEKLEEATLASHRLAADLDKLELEELPACQQATTVEEVVAHQMAIADLERAATGLDAAIQGKRRLIQENRAKLPALVDRTTDRCELLAMAELNQATQAQIDELDAKIEAEQREHEQVRSMSQMVIDQAEQTITGLETMRANIADRIDTIKARSPFVMEQFLRSEMEELATIYVEKAREIKDIFIHLHGVEMLLHSVVGPGHEVIGVQELAIPGFNLKACHDVPRKGTSSVRYLFRGDIEGHRAMAWQKSMSNQRARIRNLGITLI